MVVATTLDRYARDLIVQEQILAEIRRLGGEPFSTSAAEQEYIADDPADPSRKLIRQILGAVAEYDRAMIALRLRAGRRRKAECGGYAYGAPPYGTCADHGKLIARAGESELVARVDELHAAGCSLRQIGHTLAVEGYPLRRGKAWHPQTVARILDRLGETAAAGTVKQ